MRLRLSAVVLPVLLCTGSSFACAQDTLSPASQAVIARATLYDSPDWALIAPHLPDLKTSTPRQLESEGDVLRARRFPDDASTTTAPRWPRGGNAAQLLNKMGLACLELGPNVPARAYFQQAAKRGRRSAAAWNNLGALEFEERNLHASTSNYRRAVKLDGRSAVYDGNLAIAYLEGGNARSGRQELERALRPDPQLFARREGEGGGSARILAAES